MVAKGVKSSYTLKILNYLDNKNSIGIAVQNLCTPRSEP